MITLYTWTTPNGRKASIMLEELGAEYEVAPVNIGRNEQFDPAFLRVSPNNKIPAIVDGDVTVFETGAILLYLAETGGRLLAPSGPARFKALEWLVWSCASMGPMFGQWNYFANRAPEKVPAAIDRSQAEAVRLVGVLERRLAEAEYLGGEYGIADISTFTWCKAVLDRLKEQAGDVLGATPSVDRWMAAVEARPAVQRGLAVPKV